MVERWVGVGLLGVGVVIGMAGAGPRQEPVLFAQAGWQCRSWLMETSRNGEVFKSPVVQPLEVLGQWLGTAERIEMSAAGVDIAGRYILAACKR